MSWAVVLPGLAPSGWAAVGPFLRADPYARRRVAEASDALGVDLAARLHDPAPGDVVTEPVLFMVDTVALADRARDRLGIEPVACSGPSFGQFAAIATTGVLGFADAVALTAEVVRREHRHLTERHGELVSHYFFRTDPAGLRAAVDACTGEGIPVEVVSDLGGGFHAVTLPEPDVPRFREAVRGVGGVPLHTTRPPVHSVRFTALRDEIAALCDAEFDLSDPALPVVSDLDGSVVRTAAGVRDLLAGGYCRRVRWPLALDTLARIGVTDVCVPGPSNLFDRLCGPFRVLALGPERALAMDGAGAVAS